MEGRVSFDETKTNKNKRDGVAATICMTEWAVIAIALLRD
jgi:hypothetical protein